MGIQRSLGTVSCPQIHLLVPYKANSGSQRRPWDCSYLSVLRHEVTQSMAEVGLEPWSCLAFGQLHWYFYQVLYIQTV